MLSRVKVWFGQLFTDGRCRRCVNPSRSEKFCLDQCLNFSEYWEPDDIEEL